MRGVLAVVVLAGATVALADAPKKGSGKRVAFDVHHAPDGARYPNPIDEHYEISRDGTFYYEAHFARIPAGHNSNDVTSWKSTAGAAAVFEAVDKVAGDLVEAQPENSNEIYAVSFEGPKKAEIDRYAVDHAGKPYAAIDAPFQAAVRSFEKATGRPLKPDQLDHP